MASHAHFTGMKYETRLEGIKLRPDSVSQTMPEYAPRVPTLGHWPRAARQAPYIAAPHKGEMYCKGKIVPVPRK